MSEAMAVLDYPMARKKTGRPSTNRDDVTIKVDREIAAKLLYVAAKRKIPIAKLASDILAQPVAREFDKEKGN